MMYSVSLQKCDLPDWLLSIFYLHIVWLSDFRWLFDILPTLCLHPEICMSFTASMSAISLSFYYLLYACLLFVSCMSTNSSCSLYIFLFANLLFVYYLQSICSNIPKDFFTGVTCCWGKWCRQVSDLKKFNRMKWFILHRYLRLDVNIYSQQYI